MKKNFADIYNLLFSIRGFWCFSMFLFNMQMRIRKIMPIVSNLSTGFCRLHEPVRTVYEAWGCSGGGRRVHPQVCVWRQLLSRRCWRYLVQLPLPNVCVTGGGGVPAITSSWSGNGSNGVGWRFGDTYIKIQPICTQFYVIKCIFVIYYYDIPVYQLTYFFEGFNE